MGQRDLDLAFVGGYIFDGVRPRALRTDVGVSRGHISVIGVEAVAERTRPQTRVVDLAGGLLLPGFVDAHVHPVEGGLERLACDLSGASGRLEYLDRVRDYAWTHPDLPHIEGGGWAPVAFPGGTPLARDLDAVCPDRPVVLANRDHHGVWVNSVALRRAGIGAGTPDPPDGRIERDADGQPTGTLHEGAMDLVAGLIPPKSTSRLHAGLMEAQRYLHSLGITGWQDALIGDYGGHSSREIDAYERAVEAGELRARVNGALWWDRRRGAEQIEAFESLRARHQHELFRVGTIKIMQDGIPENRTAALIDPYCRAGGGAAGDDAGDDAGLSFIDPAELKDHVRLLDSRGFQVHFHAIGDRAVRECLDAVAEARRANPQPGPMHHIAHVQIVHPDDLARFRALRVAANIQPLWAAYDAQMVRLTSPLLGPERVGHQYPFASFLQHGGQLCAGSDWPVTSADPWLGVHVAVNRQHRAGDADWYPEVFLPGQRLTLGQALAAYTSGSARINGRHHYTGAIRLGYAADLTVADRNPFDLPKEEIGTTHTLETFVNGESVFRRTAAALT